MEKQNVYYLANFYYGELRIAVGESELEKIKLSKDSWEVVDKERYYQLETMYNAGKRDVSAKVMGSLK